MQNLENNEVNKELIYIKKDSVTFNDLTVINKELASYLEESDNRVETLINILDTGVKTLNSLKNSIERDFTKQTFDSISTEMKKKLVGID